MEKMLMRIVKYVAFAANLCVFSAAAAGLGFGVFALVDGDAVAKLFAHVAEGFEVWTVNIRSRPRPAQEETAYYTIIYKITGISVARIRDRGHPDRRRLLRPPRHHLLRLLRSQTSELHEELWILCEGTYSLCRYVWA